MAQRNTEHLMTFNFQSSHRRRNIQKLFDALCLLHFLFYFIHREVIDSSTRQLIAPPVIYCPALHYLLQ
jgi:hypothetical protein